MTLCYKTFLYAYGALYRHSRTSSRSFVFSVENPTIKATPENDKGLSRKTKNKKEFIEIYFLKIIFLYIRYLVELERGLGHDKEQYVYDYVMH